MTAKKPGGGSGGSPSTKTTSYWKSEIKRANAILKRAGAK